MVSRVPNTAVYKQIADGIREQILSGDLAPGTPLGSETAMAHHYEVGIGTIRRVIADLRADGLLETAQGQVARVREMPPVQTVEIDPSTDPHITARRATAEERRELGLADGAWVLVVTHGGFSDLYDADRTRIIVRSAE